MKFFLLLCTALFALTGASPAQSDNPSGSSFGGAPGEKALLTPSLIADAETVVAGKPFTVGLLLKMKAGWHTYWEHPGDAGQAPRVEWDLPTGFSAGSIQWPIPQAHLDEGDLLTYIYPDEVLLPVEITPPASLPPGEIKLAAKLRWLVCDKTCIPGHGEVSLALKAGDSATPANADLFQKWKALLPHPGSPAFSIKWDLGNAKQVQISVGGVPAAKKLVFIPVLPDGVSAEHPKVSEPDANGVRTVTLALSDPAPAGAVWGGLLVTEEGDQREGWLISSAKNAEATKPTAAATPAAASTSKPEAKATPNATGASSAKVTEPAATPTAPVSNAPESATTVPGPDSTESHSLLLELLLAFLGGLILNFMPCVLPVIALKIFGFVKQSKEEPKRVFRLGLAFVAGVFVFFLGLATAVVVLKSAGGGLNWGFQFQNPYILAVLIALVFVFGLNLLGVFEIALSSEATSALSALSSKSGYGGAFMHGLFTTLLGTSCTAPVLAGSLGYAVTQPAPIIFLLYLVVACGMSLPYFLLTANPSWMKHIPKPGTWMERFKQLMGFAMLAVAVWMLSVMAQRGSGPATAVFWYLFALSIACWLFGILSNRILGATILAVAIFGGYFGILYGRLSGKEAYTANQHDAASDSDGIPWQPFSDMKLASAVQAGKPVFIDFTADWCINCKVFEGTVLSNPTVKKAFRDRGITALRADWTNGDPAITAWLKRFGRIGVPLYVLYRPGEAHPVVLDALTEQIVLSNLAQIKGSSPAK